MRRLIIAVAIVVLAYLVLLVVNLFTDFADIPCQDGVWDKARNTCVPT